MSKRNYVGVAVALALGVPVAANASLMFNPDGVGGGAPTVNIEGFDWGPANALADGGNAAVRDFLLTGTAQPFEFFVQTTLTGTTGQSISGNAAPGERVVGSGDYEITLVMGFGELVSGGVAPPPVGTAIFAFDPANPLNFIEMYYDTSKNSNNLTGEGFDDGTLIMSSKVSGVGTSAFNNFGLPIGDLDRTANGDQYPTIDAINGTGNTTSLAVSVSMADMFLNPAFFPGAVPGDNVTGWNYFNISLNPFFDTIDPSACFDGAASTNPDAAGDCTDAGDVTPSIGTINGDNLLAAGNSGGDDIMFQSDFNNPVVANVPEPATLALVGLGLLGLGASSRRRKSQS